MRSNRSPKAQRLLSLALMFVVLVVLVLPNPDFHLTAAQQPDERPPSGEVIVVLKEDVPTSEFTAAADGIVEGVEPEQIYTEVFDGFSADITPAEAEALIDDPLVEAIYPVGVYRTAAQTLPTGVDRVDAELNPSTDIDQIDDVRVNADIAILDSGVSATTGDLNLVGGVDCADGAGYTDDQIGHGTHVAGIAGAIDDADTTVGVAPGSRIWSVRVLDDNGFGSDATLICGLDWAAKRSSVIDVINMSIQGEGDDGDCDVSALHLAICAVVNDAGIPVVVAAGNSSSDASDTVPATYAEVIAVSNVADYDGMPGGLGSPTACASSQVDDVFSTSSNFGADIDIAAPGTCILSTNVGGGSVYRSGTSMASPHVAGAVALYRAVNPYATPADVRAWVLGNATAQNSPEGFTGDPDAFPEPFLWLGGGGGVPTGTATPVPTTHYKAIRSGASVNSAASTYVRDGKLNTIWKTKPFSAGPPAEAWVWVDLGARKPIGNIRWVFGEYGIGDYFEIEGSNNLLTWEFITKRNGHPVGDWQEKIISKNYRYIRFRFVNVHNDELQGGLAEVQIWAPGIAPPLGSPSPTPTPSNTPTATATPPPNGNYPMYGSSRSSNSTDPKAVWDGSLITTWQTDGSGTPSSAFVYVTLGSVKPIGQIRWQYGTGDIGDDLTIELSDDKITWNPVFTDLNNSPTGIWLDTELTDTSAKYVRWFYNNPNSDPIIGGLAEVEIYAPGEGFGPGEDPTSTAAYTHTPTSTSTPTGTSTATETGTAPPVETETPIPDNPASPVPVDTDTPEPSPTDLPVDATETSTSEPASPIASEPEPSIDEPPTNELLSTETPTIAAPTPYDIVQTSRSASTMPGTLAVDGDAGTIWQTADDADPGGVAIITLDLSEPLVIDRVRILTGLGGFLGSPTIETSSDGIFWTYFADPAGVTAGEDGWREIVRDLEIAEPVTAQFVRIVFVSYDDEAVLGGVAEIELWPPSEHTTP